MIEELLDKPFDQFENLVMIYLSLLRREEIKGGR